MHFLFKFIPVISSTCFELINYSSSGGSLHAVYSIYHASTLTANTLKVELHLDHRDCMYTKLPPWGWLVYLFETRRGYYWNKFKKKAYLVGSFYANLRISCLWCLVEWRNLYLTNYVAPYSTLVYPEDGSSCCLYSVGTHSPCYMASHPISLYNESWKSQHFISFNESVCLLSTAEPSLTNGGAVKGQITTSGIWLRPFICHFTLACKWSSKPKQCAT